MLTFLQRLVLDFPFICLYFSRDFPTDKCIENSKKWFSVLGLLAHVTPSIFLVERLGVKLTIHIFFRTTVLRKLFDIRFSYKHCNFSDVCLLVKMASKTVTRSIGDDNDWQQNAEQSKKDMYILWTSYQLNITICYSYYCINTYLFSPKTLEGSKLRQISNLAFIVPRPCRSSGQVVSDNKLRHPRLLLAWVSENIKKTRLKSRRIEVKTNSKGD